MVDFLPRLSMNLSSETLALPINSHVPRRMLPSKHSSMFVSASPMAVNNKIRAIQTRKPRTTVQSYYNFSDIRPLNLTHHDRMSNSTNVFSNLSPEKLVERSKELRLSHIASHPNPRPSVLSSISIANQHSLLWPSDNSPSGFLKQTHVDLSLDSPSAFGPVMNKSSVGNMPDIPQRSSRRQAPARPSLTEQQNTLIPIHSRHKSLPKTKSSVPKAYDRLISKNKSPFISTNTQPFATFHHDYAKQFGPNFLRLYESEEDDENLPLVIDEEFEEYVQKAMVKCADWLIKYVFDKTYKDIEE